MATDRKINFAFEPNSPNNKRAVDRFECQSPVTITHDEVFICQSEIKNISSSGMCLSTNNGHWLPAEFELEVPHSIEAMIVRKEWSNGRDLGVSFVASKIKSSNRKFAQPKIC